MPVLAELGYSKIPKRVRTRKKAPSTGTPVALRYLERFLHGKSNRIQAVKGLLGCSRATAARLISKKNPYTGRLKVRWVETICKATGQPVYHVLGKQDGKTFSECVTGWHNAANFPEAMEMATDCAKSIVYYALGAYDLYGSFVVNFTNRDLPSSLAINLSPAPYLAAADKRYTPPQLVVFIDDDRTFIRYTDARGKPVTEKLLTPETAARLVHNVHKETDKIFKDLHRESNKRT